MTFETVSRSEEQTAALAAGIAGLLKPGDIIFLKGELGTGKTFFIRAAARRLGVKEPVTSPSFAMGQTYAGNVDIHHLDLYRLASFKGEDFADFEPFFDENAITFIEWPEQAEPFLEKPDITVSLFHIDEHSRRLVIETTDPDLSKRLEELVAGIGD